MLYELQYTSYRQRQTISSDFWQKFFRLKSSFQVAYVFQGRSSIGSNDARSGGITKTLENVEKIIATSI